MRFVYVLDACIERVRVAQGQYVAAVWHGFLFM